MLPGLLTSEACCPRFSGPASEAAPDAEVALEDAPVVQGGPQVAVIEDDPSPEEPDAVPVRS